MHISYRFVVDSKAYQSVQTTVNTMLHYIGSVCSSVYQRAATSMKFLADLGSKSFQKISDLATSVYHHVAHFCSVAYLKTTHLFNYVFGHIANICAVLYHKTVMTITHVYNSVADVCAQMYYKLCDAVQLVHAHVSNGSRTVYTNIVHPAYTYVSHGLTNIKSGAGVAICSAYTSVADNPVKTALIFIALLTISVILYKLYQARNKKLSERAKRVDDLLKRYIESPEPDVTESHNMVASDPFLLPVSSVSK